MSKIRLIVVTALVLVISSAALVGRHVGVPSLSQTVALAKTVGDTPWAITAYIGLFVLVSGVLAPAIALFAAAGVAWGTAKGLAIGFVAVNLAANVHFALGRFIGQRAVQGWLERRGWGRLRGELEARGVLSVVMVRQLPLPFVGVNLGFGASAVAWTQFAVGNAVGVVPNLVIYTLLASTLTQLGAERRAAFQALAAAALVFVVSLGLRWWAVRRNHRHAVH